MMPIKTCQKCGKEFGASPSRFCSAGCFRAMERDQRRGERNGFSAERRRASNMVWRAIGAGRIVRQPCEMCGHKVADAHHDDYAAPLDVRWLCRSHHKEHHDQFGPGKNA